LKYFYSNYEKKIEICKIFKFEQKYKFRTKKKKQEKKRKIEKRRKTENKRKTKFADQYGPGPITCRCVEDKRRGVKSAANKNSGWHIGLACAIESFSEKSSL
jgi:hypothetical protein